MYKYKVIGTDLKIGSELYREGSTYMSPQKFDSPYLKFIEVKPEVVKDKPETVEVKSKSKKRTTSKKSRKPRR